MGSLHLLLLLMTLCLLEEAMSFSMLSDSAAELVIKGDESGIIGDELVEAEISSFFGDLLPRLWGGIKEALDDDERL